MSRRITRRKINASCLVLFSVVFWALVSISEAALFDTAFLTGWTLATLVVLLALLNGKKKIPFIPIGSGVNWLQFHIYAGLFACMIFGLHIRLGIPTGNFEALLAMVFLLTAVSGLMGLIISRTIPKRLTNQGEPILFERIPTLIADLREDCEAIVLNSVAASNSRTVANFYIERMSPYFYNANHIFSQTLLSDRSRRQISEEIFSKKKFGGDSDSKFFGQLLDKLHQKAHLDYEYKSQALLKGWLFLHIPATFTLLLLVVIHIITVHAFDGSL